MSTKKNKWLHEFVVNKEEKIKESHTEVNDKGEKITTEKEVVKQRRSKAESGSKKRRFIK